jgi:large subunit ribosomal protein L3
MKALVPGTKVDVTSYSKGHGFAGVVKRHHFRGHPTTHGHKDAARAPGSIGHGVQHVVKGTRMAGRMGTTRVTVHNLEVVGWDQRRRELMIRGAVAGAPRALVMLTSSDQ